MHLLIVGPGALGCLLASILLQGNDGSDEITLFDYNENRAQVIRERGLIYEKNNTRTRLSIPIFSKPEQIRHADVIFLCVKSYDVKKCLLSIAQLLRGNTLLVFLQNGIAHVNNENLYGNAIPVFGTTTEGSTGLGPGHVRHAGIGKTYLGYLKEYQNPHLDLLNNTIKKMLAGGIQTEYSKTILSRIWGKLFINVGINALTVIHNCKNGELLIIPEARELLEKAVVEAISVAQCQDIPILDPVEDTITVCKATAENISSMLQDARKKRKTEIDAINGAIVALAKKHRIPTPVNNDLVKQIKGLEQQYGA